MKEIMSLDLALMSEFHEQDIHIDLSSHALTVTFANSTRATAPDSSKAAFARQVAEFIRDHYSHYSSLEMVNIGFSKVSKTGPVTVTSGEAIYQFTPQDLGAPKPETKAPKKAVPV
jgi:hypothetical protein